MTFSVQYGYTYFLKKCAQFNLQKIYIFLTITQKIA